MIKFVAECGLNHNGNLDLIYELIRQAKWSGADIVKFQLGWRGKEGELNHIDSKRLSSIIEYSNYMEIEPMFSIFEFDSYELIKPYKLQRIKIASRTVIDNPELVQQIINDNNFTYISLGMWDKDTMPFKFAENVKYLWCKSKYPLLPEDLGGFPKVFNKNKFYGYSDHTLGIETCLLAISRGAMLVEKHFTLDKSDNTIRDHALSSTPDEFFQLVKIGKEIHKLVSLNV